MGPSVAKELMFTARVFNGAEASKVRLNDNLCLHPCICFSRHFQMGVVNHSVPQNPAGDAAFQRALSLAEEIIPNGPVGVRMAKIAVNRGSDVDIDTGLAIEENCYAQVPNHFL